MDFLRRLFGGGAEAEPGRSADAEMDDVVATADDAVPTAEDAAVGGLATADLATAGTPTADAAVKPSSMSWQKVATEPGRSEYAGAVDGVRVATVIKQPAASGRDGAWEWRLDAPGGANTHGSARTLKEAKPAAEHAFGDQAH